MNRPKIVLGCNTEHPKYWPFTLAILAACTKVDEYYEKTTESPTYVMSMSMNLLLFPRKLLTYFQFSI